MSEIRPQHIVTLTELLLLGSHNNFVEINTNNLGKRIRRSQQAASQHLLDMEALGYIERKKWGQKYKIRVTEKGYFELENFLTLIRTALKSPSIPVLDFEGKVVSGMGEGAYYMSLPGYRVQFKEKLGYEPYPGTLNVKLSERTFMDARRDIGAYPSIFIAGFSDSSRTYGWAKCYLADINNGTIQNAAVLVLERTHYDNSMLEVIAAVSIKEYTGIKNGDKIRIRVHINGLPEVNQMP
jgi:riboflavin kinase